MMNIVYRVINEYHSEGVASVIKKSAYFTPRYLRHVLGAKGLYGCLRYQKFLWWINSRPYSIALDPFTIVHVDPNEITRVTGRGPNPGRFQWQDLGKVQDGNWDQSEQCFEDLPVVQALQKRFINGMEWEEIEFINKVIDNSKKGIITWRGCESKADVQEACDTVDDLYYNLKNRGYLSMETLTQKGEVPEDKYVKGDGFNKYDEVAVDISRNGQFLFVDGRHRLAIAKILGIEEIPVRISVRHANWQQKRKIIYRNRFEHLDTKHKKYLGHPDMKRVNIEID